MSSGEERELCGTFSKGEAMLLTSAFAGSPEGSIPSGLDGRGHSPKMENSGGEVGF